MDVPYSKLREQAEAGCFQGRVVLITGAASGFGRGLAIALGRYGAKLILGDISPKLDEVAKEVGGNVVARRTNMASWEEQVELFEAGRKAFGHIDVVYANAGVSEIPTFPTVEEDGPPSKPDLLTLDVNLTGVLFTVRLALYYLRTGPPREGRAIISVGSMASFAGITFAPQYSASKHGVLGLHRSLTQFTHETKSGIRTGLITPAFVGLMNEEQRAFLKDTAMASIDDVVSCMLHAASPEAPIAGIGKDGAAAIIGHGSVYAIPDAGGAFVLPHRDTQVRLYPKFASRILAATIDFQRAAAKAARGTNADAKSKL